MHKGLHRFIRYACVGFGTFLFDLGLLYLITTFLSVPYYISTAFSFFVAVNINYFISRKLIFKDSERSLHMGYLYFLGIVLCGAALTTGLVVLFVTYLHLYYLLARVIVAGIIGVGNYLLNLHFNFRVAGKH